MCPRCGAICDEAAAANHDAWHADLEQRTLPIFADYVTLPPQTEDDRPREHTPSVKAHVQLPKLTPPNAPHQRLPEDATENTDPAEDDATD